MFIAAKYGLLLVLSMYIQKVFRYPFQIWYIYHNIIDSRCGASVVVDFPGNDNCAVFDIYVVLSKNVNKRRFFFNKKAPLNNRLGASISYKVLIGFASQKQIQGIYYHWLAGTGFPCKHVEAFCEIYENFLEYDKVHYTKIEKHCFLPSLLYCTNCWLFHLQIQDFCMLQKLYHHLQ